MVNANQRSLGSRSSSISYRLTLCQFPGTLDVEDETHVLIDATRVNARCLTSQGANHQGRRGTDVYCKGGSEDNIRS